MTAPVYDPTTGEFLYDGDESCPRCEAERRRGDKIEADLNGVERENRNLRRKVTTLEAELRGAREQSAERPTVVAIFNHWVEATGRSKARTKLGETRDKAVLKMLRLGYEAEYIMRAIDGAAAFANAGSAQAEREALIAALHLAIDFLDEQQAREVRARYKAELGSAQRYDDLELICRDEVKLERFHAQAGRLPKHREQTV